MTQYLDKALKAHIMEKVEYFMIEGLYKFFDSESKALDYLNRHYRMGDFVCSSGMLSIEGFDNEDKQILETILKLENNEFTVIEHCYRHE